MSIPNYKYNNIFNAVLEPAKLCQASIADACKTSVQNIKNHRTCRFHLSKERFLSYMSNLVAYLYQEATVCEERIRELHLARNGIELVRDEAEKGLLD